jgi:DNA-binding MarR family transcriptional regulator
MIPRYDALSEIRHQIRRFLVFSERAALAAGLEPAQHQALLAIVGRPRDAKPTVGFVAQRLVVRHHTAVELVGRLARGGLVRRERSAEDRREVLLEVTAKGLRLLQKLSVVHASELRTRGPELVKSLRTVMRRRVRQGVR